MNFIPNTMTLLYIGKIIDKNKENTKIIKNGKMPTKERS